MRVNLKGLHQVRKQLANGEVETYYYAWRGGPRITAEPRTEAFVAAYAEAHAARKKPQRRTLQGLIAEFRASSDFPKAESSQRAYRTYLKMIEDRFGDMPIEALADPEVRGDFMAWRDRFAATPRKADYAWTVLARVLSCAKDRGRISVNPCEKGKRLYDPDRAEKIWTAGDISAFCAAASRELQEALVLALWTGQRQGDLLRLTWSAYDGSHIRMLQGKRVRGKRRRVVIPVGGPLKALLDDKKVRRGKAVTILTNTFGSPWTSDGFRTSWGKAFDRAELGDLHFHDIRGTAVTRLALSGCTTPEIASITGHSLKNVEAILDTHYLGGRVELAEAAIVKLNAVYGGTNREQKV